MSNITKNFSQDRRYIPSPKLQQYMSDYKPSTAPPDLQEVKWDQENNDKCNQYQQLILFQVFSISFNMGHADTQCAFQPALRLTYLLQSKNLLSRVKILCYTHVHFVRYSFTRQFIYLQEYQCLALVVFHTFKLYLLQLVGF